MPFTRPETEHMDKRQRERARKQKQQDKEQRRSARVAERQRRALETARTRTWTKLSQHPGRLLSSCLEPGYR
jgi:hypothetical protein